MLIVMQPNFTPDQMERVIARVTGLGLRPHVIPGEHSVAIGITGNKGSLDPSVFEELEGVKEAIRVTKPFKLASWDFHQKATRVQVGPAQFAPGKFVVIAGPCAVESEAQTLRIARQVKAAGAQMLRGGAFKPRTSPYAFQGLGLEGLKILQAASKAYDLPVVTEAVDERSLEMVCEYADMIQLGARNMQNFSLLQAAGKVRKPVLLKRGPSATIDEWLMAAEYILSEGNEQVVLCERGIRSFDPHTRNMLDLGAVLVTKGLSHLPVVVDPSHGTGKRTMVTPLSKAAFAVGANGILLDVHDKPEEALCDGPQAILPSEFSALVHVLKKMGTALEWEV